MKRAQLAGVYLSLFVSMICWSLSFIWYKGAYEHFGPISTIFFRLVISSALLLVFTFLVIRPRIRRRHIKLFFAAAMFEPFLYFLGESYGMQWVSPVTASVIVATIPLFTPLAGMIRYGEALSRKNVLGMLISFVGVSCVILSAGFRLEARALGVALMFVAVFSAVGYALALKQLTSIYDSITIITVQNLMGMFLFLPLWLIFENPFTTALHITFRALLPVIYLSVFASTLAFILYAYSVSMIGIARSSVFINLIPILTSIFAYFILDESLSPVKIAGVIIVVAGLLLTQWEVLLKVARNGRIRGS